MGQATELDRMDENIEVHYASLNILRRARSLWVAGTMNRATPSCAAAWRAVPIATEGAPCSSFKRVFFDIPRPSAASSSERPAVVRAALCPSPREFEGLDWLGKFEQQRVSSLQVQELLHQAGDHIKVHQRDIIQNSRHSSI